MINFLYKSYYSVCSDDITVISYISFTISCYAIVCDFTDMPWDFNAMLCDMYAMLWGIEIVTGWEK